MPDNDEFLTWKQKRDEGKESLLGYLANGVTFWGVPFAIIMYVAKLASDDRLSPTAKLITCALIVTVGGGAFGFATWFFNELRYKKARRTHEGIEPSAAVNVANKEIPTKYIVAGFGIVLLICFAVIGATIVNFVFFTE